MSDDSEKMPLILTSQGDILCLVLFFLTKSYKHEDIQFSIIYDKETHQILTFSLDKVEEANICHFKKRLK